MSIATPPRGRDQPSRGPEQNSTPPTTAGGNRAHAVHGKALAGSFAMGKRSIADRRQRHHLTMR
ncbi:hypothetical protein RB628_39745, partial [Streptomyces sp. ADMS]|uniref:hypothetical protein n=1 Tax=Streptomyces sp. ADMS TaxID=3071415 RepID=UPI00296E8777